MTNARFCIIPARALGDKRLNRTDIMVLNALGMFGDKEGWSFPSIGKIAEMINAHRVSVSNALSKLAECGYVDSRPRYRDDGSQTSNEYRILFDAPAMQGSLDLENPRAAEYPDPPPVADSLPPHSETATPPIASSAIPPIAHTLYLMNDPTLTTQVKKNIPRKNKNGDDYPIEFENVWNVWPKERRCEKTKAYEAWQAACEKIAPDELLEAVKRYLASEAAKPNKNGEIFVPYPARWLNRERWLEFPSAEVEKEIALGELGGDKQEKDFLTALHQKLRKKFGDSVYRSWFLPSLRAMQKQGKDIIFTVPTRFMAEWLKTHYAGDIEGFARQIWPHVMTVDYMPANMKIATP